MNKIFRLIQHLLCTLLKLYKTAHAVKKKKNLSIRAIKVITYILNI